MADLLPFFVGVLVCSAIAWAGERSHRHFEARRRQYVARIRGTKVPGLSVERAVGGAHGRDERPDRLDEAKRGHGAHAVEKPRVHADRLVHVAECAPGGPFAVGAVLRLLP